MKHSKILVMAAILSLAISCSRTNRDVNVVLIGLDGWGSFCWENAEMPTVKALMDEGSWTLNKRSVLKSASAINWASMLNGVPTELHGFTKWNSKAPVFAQPTEERIPSIFTILRQQKPESVIESVYEWDGVKYVIDSTAFDKRIWTGKDTLDINYTTEQVEKCLIEDKPDLFYVHYDQPDHEGHGKGFGSAEYYDILPKLDLCIKRIIEATKTAGTFEKTIFIVTSDHGGIEKSHGGETLREMETPFVICGPGIKKGHKLETFMMQYDVASTIAFALGLKQPELWRGRPVDCFE